ncbi:MAG TPA: Rieske 2Fe-2S domain-containing protein [Bacteroidia bacterium]|nr:Rieske 2Fe-2S domain-containing protein [Bacteroidia bacterium]
MNRKDFLLKIIGGASVAAFIASCKKNNSSPTPSGTANVNFTIDITSAAYAALQSNGGYVYVNSIIIGRVSAGNYLAIYDVCTHTGCTIQFNGSQFPCPCHGSLFDANGNVVTGPASTPLKKYNTSLSGNLLRVYS